MARPFRFVPPEPPTHALVRRRLLDRLAKRWTSRVITIVAGPGFGKTSLLSAAVAEGSLGGLDRDVWLSCEPGDGGGDALVTDLGLALGLERPGGVDDVVRAVWALAPARVCVVLDDVHEVSFDSSGSALIAQLVEELPYNAGLVLSSRSQIPIPTARLMAGGLLHRITEEDLLLDEAELASFAAARGVDPAVLVSSGGWLALAELAAAACEDLVFEYVWDEVLATLGDERTSNFARLVTVGGGDDEIVAAIAPGVVSARALVTGVPLVEFTRDGWVSPHPLWVPVVRGTLDVDEARDARVAAAAVHRSRRDVGRAIDLYAEAEHWDEVLATVRLAALELEEFDQWPEFGAWRRRIPAHLRSHPIARLAEGIEIAAQVPLDAEPALAAAAAGFRDLGDSELEMVAIERHGVVKWWSNDVVGLYTLYERALELADQGVDRGARLALVGQAAIAHLSGDPTGVLDTLDRVESWNGSAWAPTIIWFRHVAYRRLGDLARAELMLESSDDLSDHQLELARLRTDWLSGRVELVAERTRSIAEHYVAAEHDYLWVEAALESAARFAWLGDRGAAGRLLDEVRPHLDAVPGALARVLLTIASAMMSVGVGDEHAARRLLVDEPLALPGRAESWYWHDRAAVALVHQLLPEHRQGWIDESSAPVHRVGIRLSEALASARDGDLASVRSLTWPTAGLARAHLPAPWLAELATFAEASGNPAPAGLLDVIDDTAHEVWPQLAARSVAPEVQAAARQLASRFAAPRPVLEIRALGSLELVRDGERVEHPNLRRRRVRELICRLVIDPEQRRDALADTLWPDQLDPRQNLRVTLSYLQRVLEPSRGRGEPALHLVTDQRMVRLVASQWLRCDLWDLDALLDAGATAERDRNPAAALASYSELLPLWRGEPFADLEENDWLRDERTRRTARVVGAWARAGELLLARKEVLESIRFAERAVAIDPHDERAHRVLVRAHLARDDTRRARQALDACLRALDELAVSPDQLTRELIAELGSRQ